MADGKNDLESKLKHGRVLVQPGKPLQILDEGESSKGRDETRAITSTIGASLKAYQAAAKDLLTTKYNAQRDLAPPQLRNPCDVFVVVCRDGVLVRYDPAAEDKPKIRCAKMDAGLAEAAPNFSERVVFIAEDPGQFVLDAAGPGIYLNITAPDGSVTEQLRTYPYVCATLTFPSGFQTFECGRPSPSQPAA